MKDKLINPFTYALFESDLITTRIILAIAELTWCIMLFWPGQTFDPSAYTIMGMLMPEICWAFVFGTSSVLQFLVVIKQSWYEPWARVFATWNASLWILVVGSIALSAYPPPAAIGGEIALALAAVWIWARPLLIERGKKYGEMRSHTA